MSEYDLTPAMAPYFEIHLVLFLLDFLRDNEVYDLAVITKKKIQTILKTNLIDSLEDEYGRFPDNAEFQAEFPKLESRRDEIFEKLDHVPEDVQKVHDFFGNTALIEELKKSPGNFSLEVLSAAPHNITAQALENYYKRSKFEFECGNYADAELKLGNYLKVNQPQSSSKLGALWGRLACRILTTKWSDALLDLSAVKEGIEVRGVTPTDQLRQRAWLLHWSLFVLINQPDGPDKIAEFFSEKAHLQTIENLCPWLLRYFTAFVVLSPSYRQRLLPEVLQEIQTMSYLYSDPVTEFLSTLYNDFDFDEAQVKLRECEKLMKNDFFLQIYAGNFVHEARVLMCEMYCSINKRVDLVQLAAKLEMSDEEVERWMIDMVRNAEPGAATVDAKIDCSARQVVMATPSKSGHQLVVDRARDLTARSAALCSNLSTLVEEQELFLKNKP